ncbi:MAG: alanine racemase [Rickettsiaceae bacterium]
MSTSKCVLNINLDTIERNYNILRQICGNSEVGAAVKANCYGLGADKIAPMLQKAGCQHFFVANCDEGVTLRQTLGQIPYIYVLNGVFTGELSVFKEYNLVPVLNYLEQLITWQNFAQLLGKKLPCLIHVDTGMHRLGMSEREFDQVVSFNIKELDILYVMSHLASAEEPENPYNENQLNKFTKIAGKVPKIKRSLANSSGIFLGKGYHFDLVRPGAALYGINPTPSRPEAVTENPVSLFAPIIQIHELGPNESAGYNSTYINNTNVSCQIATIPIGYADGVDRHLSNKGVMYINGIKAPIIGRVSMDLTIIDLSLIPQKDIFLGQQVEVMGPNNKLDDIAKLADTNGYEILTKLGYRFEKIYTYIVTNHLNPHYVSNYSTNRQQSY